MKISNPMISRLDENRIPRIYPKDKQAYRRVQNGRYSEIANLVLSWTDADDRRRSIPIPWLFKSTGSLTIRMVLDRGWAYTPREIYLLRKALAEVLEGKLYERYTDMHSHQHFNEMTRLGEVKDNDYPTLLDLLDTIVVMCDRNEGEVKERAEKLAMELLDYLYSKLQIQPVNRLIGDIY